MFFLFVLRNKYTSLPLIVLYFLVTLYIIIKNIETDVLIYGYIKNGGKVKKVEKIYFSRLVQTVLKCK